ncbi:MAG: hypothetical protein MI863_02710 [Desulfobacterales bacterium]|nr:hypothetical protein [Desulfobacterales bacterium]
MLFAKITLVAGIFGFLGLINKAKVDQSSSPDDQGTAVICGVLAAGCILVCLVSGIFIFFAG